MLDLEQFEKMDKPVPTSEDYEILQQILVIVESIQSDDGPRQLEKALADVFKSSKNERDVVIEILACIEVLKPGASERSRKGGKNDWEFAENWRGEDGYNKAAVRQYFGVAYR